MAPPTDRVRLLKVENPSTGGTQDNEGFPAQLDPGEDAPSVQGMFVQPSGGPEDETVYITRDGSGNLIFRDAADGTERTLTDLIGGAAQVNYRRHFLLMGA